MNLPTETPRTDAVAFSDYTSTKGYRDTEEIVPADFARQLERELAAAQDEIALITSPAEAVGRVILAYKSRAETAEAALAGLREAFDNYDVAREKPSVQGGDSVHSAKAQQK